MEKLNQMVCKRILLLTGTPIQNNIEELWTILNYIEPKRFQHKESFLNEFGSMTEAGVVDKLNAAVKPYLLRRVKLDVEKSIPPLTETIIDVEMTTP